MMEKYLAIIRSSLKHDFGAEEIIFNSGQISTGLRKVSKYLFIFLFLFGLSVFSRAAPAA